MVWGRVDLRVSVRLPGSFQNSKLHNILLQNTAGKKNKLGDRAIKQDRMRVALEILSSQQRSLKV